MTIASRSVVLAPKKAATTCARNAGSTCSGLSNRCGLRSPRRRRAVRTPHAENGIDQDRKNSGINPMLLTFTNNASVSKAPGLGGHEGRGRRVFDWEDQFEVDQRFHGSLTINRPFFSPGFVLEHEPLSTIRHFLAPLPPRYFGRWYEIRRAEKEASSKRDRATGCARRPNSPPPARRALLRYRHLPASLASTSDTCDCATSPTTAVYALMQCNRLRPSEYDAKGCASDAPLSEPDHELTVCIRNVALPTAPTAASASARRGRVFYEMKNAWSSEEPTIRSLPKRHANLEEVLLPVRCLRYMG